MDSQAAMTRGSISIWLRPDTFVSDQCQQLIFYARFTDIFQGCFICHGVVVSLPQCGLISLENKQRAHDVVIPSLLRENDAETSFRRNNDVIITSCFCWGKKTQQNASKRERCGACCLVIVACWLLLVAWWLLIVACCLLLVACCLLLGDWHCCLWLHCFVLWKLRWNIMSTHWGRVTHICVGKLTIIGSDNGLSPERRQTIIWTNAGILLIGPLGTNFREIVIEIQTFSLKKIRLKMSSAKCCSFRLGLNVLTL